MKNKIITILLAIVALLGGSYSISNLGSIDGQAYNFVNATSAIAGVHTVLKTTNAQLGSIVVASTSAHTFTVWNATSTTDSASTTVTTIKASSVEGTYTYDVSAPRGLIIAPASGFVGNYTVTYK